MTKWNLVYTRNALPLTIYPVLEGNVFNMKKAFGKTHTALYLSFHDKKIDGYEKVGEEEELSKIVARRILENPRFLRTVEKEIKKAIKNLLLFSGKIKRSRLSKLSNQKLSELLLEFNHYYSKIFDYGLVNTYDSSLVKIARGSLARIISDPRKVNFYFTILTTPIHQTYYRREEQELLRIALFLEQNKGKINKEIDQKIKEHQKKYGWLLVNYEGEERTKEDFSRMLKELLAESTRPSHSLKDLRKQRGVLIEKQQKFKKELSRYSKVLYLLEAIKINARLREYRKPLCVRAIFETRRLINEIAKRLELTPSELKFLFPFEIKEFLLDGRPDKNKIKERQKLVLVYITPKQFNIYTGKKAKKILSEIKPKRTAEKWVSGLAACLGRVRGKVRIILGREEMQEFKKGEIFVGTATSPELVPVLKKSRAIVTDEGGMTCHAAIISRELNIPCLVGTKKATEVFKNGDTIEVDALSGIAKKIN